jgi:PAS domain S-box-containing protein
MEKHKITLLLLEQNKEVSECLVKAISKHISQVIVARSTEEAYQTYLKKRPDIVLTDFSTLPKTGTEFIHQIRKHDKKTRIIITSSKVDPQLFIKSIEFGVKGFLQKPIIEEQLAGLLTELTKDIQLEKDFETEERNRLKAEQERDRSEKILETLSQATALFFRYGISPTNIDKILKLIGKATKSSRVNLFKNFEDAGEKFTGLVYTWAKNDFFDISLVNELRKIPFLNSSISGWESNMKKGRSIVGLVKDFDEYEQKMLIKNKVKSILSIPIFVDKDWWGFLSLDDCEKGRNWSQDEIRALETVAYNLGAAIYRLKVERDMIRINESLENRVSERTAALEDEIAERMLTEELLKDREEKYRLIFENATDGIVLVQYNKVVLANPSMIEIMERSPKLLIGKQFGNYIVSSRKSDISGIIASLNKNKRKSKRIEITIPNKDNKWLEMKITKITWDKQPAFLIFATDISLQVKAENELKQLNKNLIQRIKQEIKQVKEQQNLLNQKSKLESLGELSAGLAHEINQPLLGISMGLDNILMAAHEENFSPSYIINKTEVLFKDIDRIKQIIEHVRTFSRGQENTANERIEVNSMIRNTLILANKMLNVKHIDFNVKLSKNKLFVMGNPYRLEQVLLNLLSNARHAVDEDMPEEAAEQQQKNISLEVSRKNKNVIIAVTDDGIGIPETNISKIFDPFYTTKNAEKGTGLGLSISYGIINEMNGTIEVDSIVNQYTTISIKLPVYN